MGDGEYLVRLMDFEGPLDLLLHLIRESKMDIKTVRLADVTGQYLEYLTQIKDLKETNFALAMEFIDIASTLIEIKSRNILPKPKGEEEVDDTEARLKQQLEEYKILKEASEKLKDLENPDRFYKAAAEFKPEHKFVLDNLSLEILTEAFSRIMHKLNEKTAAMAKRQIRLDRFSVKDKINDIRGRVRGGKGFTFFDLFDADFTKSEMINTFLALLELLKTGEIRAVQKERFADIQIVGANESERAGRDTHIDTYDTDEGGEKE
jgi:segregation and condensation protein A